MTAALEARAQTGDVAAQFELAVALDRAGRRAEATPWMERAASAGHTEALAVLAVNELQARDTASAHARLTRAAALGGNSARRLLGLLTALEGSWRDAVALVIEAARAGDVRALRELAFLVEMARPASLLSDDLLLRAGLAGDGYAGFAILQRQARQGRTLAPEHVFAQWRAGIARNGHPLAHCIANVAASAAATPSSPNGDVNWNDVAAILSEPPSLQTPAAEPVTERPTIRRIDGLLTAEACEYLIGLAARILMPAEIVDGTTGTPKQSQVRSNSVAPFWPVHQDLVVHAINLRLAAAANVPAENGELTNILMYKPGEEYRPHYDFFPVEAVKADPAGQRIATLLVYLNDDYDDGETHFLKPGIKIKGKAGDAILFQNCDATGTPDKSSLHAGLAVARGKKWLLSKWYREKRFVA